MTMVVACQFPDGAVVIADARASWEGSLPVFQDNLQKILALGAKTSISFAGDVQAAAIIVNQLRQRIRKKPRLGILRKLATEIPRVARHYYRLSQSRSRSRHSLTLVLAGVDGGGNVRIWSYESPHFNGHKLTSGFSVFGSGARVKSYVQGNWDRLQTDFFDLKSRADRLLVGLEEELQKQQIDTVGGLLQVILLDSRGIRTLRYGFVTLDPEGTAYAKNIEMSGGRWIQRDQAKSLEVPLVEPIALIARGPASLRFHDFRPQPEEKTVPKWHLTYFLTCLGIRQDVGTSEFRGVFTRCASLGYPRLVNILSAVGLWGSPGDHNMEFKMVLGERSERIHTQTIHIDYLPEEVEFTVPLAGEITEPGLVFLECYISNQLLGRRALYFGRALDAPSTEPGLAEYGQTLRERILAEERACRDPTIEESRKSELVYLSLCQGCTEKDGDLIFERQFVAVYGRSYPLPLRLFVASAFRMPEGDHVVRVDFVNAATREVSPIGGGGPLAVEN